VDCPTRRGFRHHHLKVEGDRRHGNRHHLKAEGDSRRRNRRHRMTDLHFLQKPAVP